MCGIVGYIGKRNAQPILLNSLKRLEYRGYDSCGIALRGSDIRVYKDIGRVRDLENAISVQTGRIGIGHTRWATHGKPSQCNAHPHTDCTGKIAVVHNGIITNFQTLKEQLMNEGHHFQSDTDTEVIPHLIEKYYGGDLEEAIRTALCQIEGSYAVIVIHADYRGIIVARNESPLIIGMGDHEYFVASDVPAVLDCTDKVVYLEDGDVGILNNGNVNIFNSGSQVTRSEQRISWSAEEAQKAGYKHYMLKEIHEQPKAIENTFSGHISAIEPMVDMGIDKDFDFSNILFLACGTSYHAAMIGKYIIERIARIPVRVELASEFNSMDLMLDKTWAIGITQSGETADTLKALKKVKSQGCKALAITNVMDSSATRIADDSFYTRAGIEIGVAATKSYITQLVALYMLALSIESTNIKALKDLTTELRMLPNKVQNLLHKEERIAGFGKYLARYQHVFYIARGINFPAAMEGALKLKEISYIHAEAYAAGELKHGPLALLTPETPVIAVAAKDDTYEKMLSNIKEVKARESPLIAIAEEGDEEINKFADQVICVPRMNPLYSPVLNAVALQILAYYTAKERNCPIDMPRNLAKSVTVE
jgi:glucosamine--fructose-6-phosphate aminotransferase (isomerizing)